MKQRDCSNCRFKSPRGHGYPPLVFVVCCISSCLCNELITHSQESYRYVFVCVYDREISAMRWPGAELGCCMTEKEYDNQDRDLRISYIHYYFASI